MNATLIFILIVVALIALPILILYCALKRHQEYRVEVTRKMNGMGDTVTEMSDEIRMINEGYFFHQVIEHFNFLLHLKLETKYVSTFVNNTFLEDRLYETIILTLSKRKGLDVLRLRSAYPYVSPAVLEYTLISASDILQETTTDTTHLIDGNFKIIFDHTEYDIKTLIDELLSTFIHKPRVVNVY